IINAAYEPEQNSITIPAGILKAPFFDAARPFAINHGSIGVVIGHEFTHGLDDQGRQYDEVGNLKNWWTPAAIKAFSERSKCFVEEYGRQVEKSTGLHLNGQNTLGENIADNGGTHESFNAYKAREAASGASPTLADLPKFTSDQLFFLSYANTWCSLTRPEKLKQQIEYDPHSPSQYRVNVPLSNSADFARAFSCPAGSPMNPSG
ncbi:PREDICTED: neprilysin-1-like, partial [Rhagoletis zephyria]|uniref:neprilysin-1-like n=1 Tax=Rhagoletis zephyria TaxID=28612 RepID=UPI0008118366